ncbi:glycerophosphodiester phosphodiesterase [Nautilia sp.]
MYVFNKRNVYIAHRGYRAYFPENTIYAFKAALNRFDMFEFDVRFTKDLVPVVYHDDDLLGCTNVKELFEKHRVKDLTYEQIKKLDNVSWFIRKNPFHTELDYGFLNALSKNSIPSLDEVLEFIKKNDFWANLEIKNSDLDPDFVTESILSRIERFDVKEYMLISSFNHEYIKRIDGFYKAALFDKRVDNPAGYLKKLNAGFYHINTENVRKRDIEELLDSGIYTNVYTVNDRKLKSELFKKGVKGVFCDY